MDSPVQNADQKGPQVRAMFAAIAARYDLANHFLSGGLDFLWRRRVGKIIQGWMPKRILDLATGSGDLARVVSARCPRAFVVGADFCVPMLVTARDKGVANLVAADAIKMPFADGAFDALTVAFGLRNMASWLGALVEMRRVLAPSGHLLVLDFSIPPAPFRWIYRPYLHHVLPRLAALVTGEKAAYEYLGDSIEQFPQDSEMCCLIESAGFGAAKCKRLSGGIVSLYTAECV